MLDIHVGRCLDCADARASHPQPYHVPLNPNLHAVQPSITSDQHTRTSPILLSGINAKLQVTLTTSRPGIP